MPTDFDSIDDLDLRARIAEAMGWKFEDDVADPKRFCHVTAPPPKPGYADASGVYIKVCRGDWMNDAYVPSPITDANDLREVRLWAFETHGLSISVVLGDRHIHAQMVNYHPIGHLEDHDSTRPSIIRAEGRAVVIAILKAVENQQPLTPR